MTMLSLFDPPARASDPETSHAAAAAVRAGNDELIRQIRAVVAASPVPLTAYQIADAVYALTGGKRQRDSVRTACAPKRGARLRVVDRAGRSPGGRAVQRYSL